MSRLVLVLTLLLPASLPPAATAADRPNIVLIYADDLGYGDLSCYGAVKVRTPSCDKLAAAGVRFTDGHSVASVCTPSRYSMMTGEYAFRKKGTGIASGVAGLLIDPGRTTLASMLQKAGYRTGLIGKYLNLYEDMLISQGHPYVPPGWDEWDATTSDKYFDYTLVENGLPVYYGTNTADYATDVLKTKALNFITQSAGMGQPFFLYFSVPAPHEPYTPAPRHAGSYAAISNYRPSNYNEGNVADKPAWVQATPLLTTADQAQIDGWRKGALEWV